MKTQNKDLNNWLNKIKTRNTDIKRRSINKKINLEFYNTMAALGVIVFFNDSETEFK